MGRRIGRAGGVGGQEEWEGRRAGLVQTPGRPMVDSELQKRDQKNMEVHIIN